MVLQPEATASLGRVAKILHRWDSSGAGVICRKDFIVVFLKLCTATGLGLHDIEGLLDSFDPAGSKMVQYDAFLQWLTKPFAISQLRNVSSPSNGVAAGEQSARLLLLFERLPKLLGHPDKVKKQKLRKSFPHFVQVVEALVSGYLDYGDEYYQCIERHLKAQVPGGGEELMKYTKYFTGSRTETGAFESVSAFLVTADNPPLLVAKPIGANHQVEVPRGTVELKDFATGFNYHQQAAALREAQEELEVTFEVDPCNVRALARKHAKHVRMPVVDPAALKALVEFARSDLAKLPETPEEHANALFALDRIVGSDGRFPNLLRDAAKWFDAKDWVGYFVPVGPWADFQTMPGVTKKLLKQKLVCLPLDGSEQFQIEAGVCEGNTLVPDGWSALGLPEHVASFFQNLVHSE